MKKVCLLFLPILMTICVTVGSQNAQIFFQLTKLVQTAACFGEHVAQQPSFIKKISLKKSWEFMKFTTTLCQRHDWCAKPRQQAISWSFGVEKLHRRLCQMAEYHTWDVCKTEKLESVNEISSLYVSKIYYGDWSKPVTRMIKFSVSE